MDALGFIVTSFGPHRASQDLLRLAEVANEELATIFHLVAALPGQWTMIHGAVLAHVARAFVAVTARTTERTHALAANYSLLHLFHVVHFFSFLFKLR